MVRFGSYLESQRVEEWKEHYLDYDKLKGIIEALSSASGGSEEKKSAAQKLGADRVTSLSTGGAHKSAVTAQFEGKPVTEATFFASLEEEMAKVDKLTHQEQVEIKKAADALEASLGSAAALAALPSAERDELDDKAKELGDRFLRVEKFANLNYLGFHKILKKHDKQMLTPCRRFYLTRLHNQRWVRHDYSKLFVELSKIHSLLRGDQSGENDEAGSQNFIRTTTKFWVRTEDVSRVKHTVLQHLPVFQHNIDALAGDSQFCSSVYFDNTHMQLYHGRLDKTPNAIAIRFRWYATALPELVFVERKTHRDSWTGEVSVKERFTLLEHQVMPFLRGEFTVEDKMAEMRAKNKTEKDMANARRLFTEIYQQIESKQLRPTMRTVYNRVAYQIPFDATVRISLDSNLTMIAENPKVGPDCATEKRWYRNPNIVRPPTDITQFPHAVLEVKLSLKEGQDMPKWVADLTQSSICTQVHKFSKFIHGCATLLPDQVQAFPYWIDDISIRPSILRSQPVQHRRSGMIAPPAGPKGAKPGTFQPIQLMERKKSFNEAPGKHAAMLTDAQDLTSTLVSKPRATPMKIEPKVFLSNERTLLSWLSISITLGALATALMGTSSTAKAPGSAVTSDLGPHLMGFMLMPIALLFAIYAYSTFVTRRKYLRLRLDNGQFFDENGPFFLGISLMTALTVIFITKL